MIAAANCKVVAQLYHVRSHRYESEVALLPSDVRVQDALLLLGSIEEDATVLVVVRGEGCRDGIIVGIEVGWDVHIELLVRPMQMRSPVPNTRAVWENMIEK